MASIVDRVLLPLRYWILRRRHDWWYRWAHDPLCERLGGGVLTIGKLRLCRSCLAMYLGIGVGLAAVVVSSSLRNSAAFPLGWLAAASVLTGLSLPIVYRYLGRWFKDALRFCTGITGGVLPALAFSQRWVWLGLILVLAIVGYRSVTVLRARSKATACDGCPELDQPGICSGFSQQAVSLRAYEEEASAIAAARRFRQMA